MLNLFSDPKLRARQDILDGQWNSLWSAWNSCDQTPDSLFPSFATDRNNWKTFYNSEADWTANSFNATNEWQAKAQSWSEQLTAWGCNGNTEVDYDSASGIAGVKAPPVDEVSVVSSAIDKVGNLGGGLFDTFKTMGWVAVFLVVGLGIGLIYLLTHIKASTPQGSVG